jgi:tetratricopeptide (TPR) repeat protein
LGFSFLPVSAQYNIKKMMEEGRNTLDAGFYVISLQIFGRVAGLKPNMYEAWYLMGLSKYHLDDFEGAEQDCTEAIKLNPYIADIFDLRAMSRIQEEKFDSAAVDYTRALDLQPANRTYWYNRAYCYYYAGERQLALEQLHYIVNRWRNFQQARTLLREVQNGRKPERGKGRWIDSRRTRFVINKNNLKL